MGEVVEFKGDDGHSLPDKNELNLTQLRTTVDLGDEITTVITMLKGAKKLGVEKRSSVLAKLVKSQETLVKTQRLILGMDSDSASIVNKGVIILPQKSEDWPDAAKKEIDSARRLLSPGGSSDSVEDIESSQGEDATDDDGVED